MRQMVVLALVAFAPFEALGEDIGWPAYGGAPGGGHHTAAAQITPDNVHELKVAWTHRSGDFREGTVRGVEGFSDDAVAPSAFVGTPIVVNDTLYYCTPFNRVFALNPQTGEERWVFDPGVNIDDEHLTNCRAVSSWTDPELPADALCSHRIIAPTLDGRIFALDGKTGTRCPEFGDNGEIDLTEGLTEHGNKEYGITSAPAIVNDVLVSGAYVTDSIRIDIPSGVVRAYDLRTGKFRWGWNSVPPGMPERDADGKYRAGTTNVWSTISVDAERNLVIVPTGNSSPDYYGGQREGNLDYYSSSVVALNAETGKVVWHYQTVHHDIWDFDLPAQPTLVDLTIDGKTRPAVVQVTKMGLTFVLDRETGKPLFPVEERAVPQEGAAPGEYLSPTQPFPLKPDPLNQLGISPDDAWGFTFLDEGWCRDELEAMTTGPIYTPISVGKETPLYPSVIGGQNWGAPAVDPERQLMIANGHHVPMVLKLIPRDECTGEESFPQAGSPYCATMRPFVSRLGAPCTKPPWGTLSSVDLSTGDLLWQVPLGTIEHHSPLAIWPISRMKGGIQMGGPIVTASGLVFIGAAADRRIRAFDIETGEELWADELPTSANAVPMSYVSGGRQYVVVAAGGNFTSPSPPGDHVTAYALPEAQD
ncbi:MAG: pyrroloquinoline quinone-dependent dehydrogenase [Gammaproteobacteria bacterium]|nr:pyrroloquinoline quinone-dependent dehydrogenase [Gammaproteobacteria bacterium]